MKVVKQRSVLFSLWVPFFLIFYAKLLVITATEWWFDLFLFFKFFHVLCKTKIGIIVVLARGFFFQRERRGFILQRRNVNLTVYKALVYVVFFFSLIYLFWCDLFNVFLSVNRLFVL
ncbi:hypothetical protein Tcan_06759 [Toxocara canis]|uniref:Uncharacterized protein n=1 Tax=Toxocara canis TaxID=6265 RepID=A0A0B2VYE8_TOXCA|nr:hypothetical protein Tcan_06759 [Toxocara canis]